MRHRDARVGRRGYRGSYSRHHLEGYAGSRKGHGLLAAATEDEGVASLQPDDAPALRCPRDEQGVDVALVRALPAGRLARVDHLGVHAGAPKEPRVHEPVADHDVGRLQQLQSPDSYEPGVAGSRADEIHDAGHRGHGSSISAASSISKEASVSPISAGDAVGDATSRRNTWEPSGAAAMPWIRSPPSFVSRA